MTLYIRRLSKPDPRYGPDDLIVLIDQTLVYDHYSTIAEAQEGADYLREQAKVRVAELEGNLEDLIKEVEEARAELTELLGPAILITPPITPKEARTL